MNSNSIFECEKAHHEFKVNIYVSCLHGECVHMNAVRREEDRWDSLYERAVLLQYGRCGRQTFLESCVRMRVCVYIYISIYIRMFGFDNEFL